MSKLEYLSPREAANRLSISLNSVYALLWSGKLKATNTEKRWRIPLSAVEERLEKRRQ